MPRIHLLQRHVTSSEPSGRWVDVPLAAHWDSIEEVYVSLTSAGMVGRYRLFIEVETGSVARHYFEVSEVTDYVVVDWDRGDD